MRALTRLPAWRVLRFCTALGIAAGACSDVTDVERLEISASGAVMGQAYLDLNGSGEADAGDEPITGVSVVLSSSGGAGVAVAEVETDEEGAFMFQDVLVGTYAISIEPDVLADSLITVGEVEPVRVTLGEAEEIVLGATFPQLTIEEVRAAEPGRKVFTTGIALNARQSFSEGGIVFLKGDGGYLQATDVERTPEVVLGDSVRFLGRTARRGGRPALEGVTPVILIRQAQIPLPVEVSTAVAAAAEGGPLDAALVRIRAATVSDTVTVANGDFHFTADDGSGPVEIVLRSFLGFPVRPGDDRTVSQAVGMLAPYDDGSGTVRWSLLVRAASELVLEP